MEWKIRNDLPIYAQLVDQIKLAVASGAFSPGERLASVRDMAAEAGEEEPGPGADPEFLRGHGRPGLQRGGAAGAAV